MKTRINLFEIAWLSDEQIRRFKSDFRIVADYFSKMRRTGSYKGSPDEIRPVIDAAAPNHLRFFGPGTKNRPVDLKGPKNEYMTSKDGSLISKVSGTVFVPATAG